MQKVPDIEELIAASTPRNYSPLLDVDPVELARYVADTTHKWNSRWMCALALAGRVPEKCVSDLISRVRDDDEVTEVRRALLAALSDREELLPWLIGEEGRKFAERAQPSVLHARGRLGDRTAIPGLVELAASPWHHEAPLGAAGLDALAARYGLDAVLADVGDESPEARMYQVRMRAAAGQDVAYALADEDRAVAYTAQALISDADRLRRYLEEAPTDEAKLWAAYRLYALTNTEDEARAVYEALGRPRVEVPGLDEQMRRIIVHGYARRCERQSDPRWRLEAICTEPPPDVDLDAQLSAAAEALRAAGLEPLPALSAGEYHRQGGGSYHVVFIGDQPLVISTLGWYVRGSAAGAPTDAVARRALEGAGFRWIDDEVAAIRVTDLCVSFFGRRGDLPVSDLLFFWQD